MKDFKPTTYSNGTKDVTNFAGLCKGCGMCIEKCPQDCLEFDNKRDSFYGNPAIKCDINKCIACGICEIVCPEMAMRVDKDSQ